MLLLEVKAVAHLITRVCGGYGAIREIVEVILKSQGTWLNLIGAAGTESDLSSPI